jgi:hypothetical protein
MIDRPIEFDEHGVSRAPVAISSTGAPVFLFYDADSQSHRYVLKTRDPEGNECVVFVDRSGVMPPETDPSLGIGMLAGIGVGLAAGLLPGLVAGATGMLLGQLAKPARYRRLG